MPASASPKCLPLHGIWRIIPSPALTEIFAQSGMNFQILDCEHGGYDYATLLADIVACERHDCTPFVRVSGTNRIEVQRCLDFGARGLVFPQLATFEDFSRAAAMMDYPPAGTRGYNPFVRACDYGVPAVPSAVARPRPWFVPIVETLEAARNIDAIVQLPRIDLIYIGSYDLSAQLGCAGRMDAPELATLVDDLLATCQRARKPVGLMAPTIDAARAFAARGVQVLVHGIDSYQLKRSTTALVAPLRELRLPVDATAAKL